MNDISGYQWYQWVSSTKLWGRSHLLCRHMAQDIVAHVLVAVKRVHPQQLSALNVAKLTALLVTHLFPEDCLRLLLYELRQQTLRLACGVVRVTVDRAAPASLCSEHTSGSGPVHGTSMNRFFVVRLPSAQQIAQAREALALDHLHDCICRAALCLWQDKLLFHIAHMQAQTSSLYVWWRRVGEDNEKSTFMTRVSSSPPSVGRIWTLEVMAGT